MSQHFSLLCLGQNQAGSVTLSFTNGTQLRNGNFFIIYSLKFLFYIEVNMVTSPYTDGSPLTQAKQQSLLTIDS